MIFEKLAALRALYPEDIETIEAEETRIKELLKRQEYSELETTKELMGICRKDIVAARRKLATDRSLIGNEAAQRELWHMIDARSWFLELVSKNFAAELQTIEQELEAELLR